MQIQLLRELYEENEEELRHQFINAVVKDKDTVYFDSTVAPTVEVEEPHGSRRHPVQQMYVATHRCDTSVLWDVVAELWACSDWPDSDFLLWRLYIDGNEAGFPVRYCPMCGCDLDAFVHHRDEDESADEDDRIHHANTARR